MVSHRSVPTFEEPVVKSGFLLKKGARSSSYSKRCAVLLSDRLVIYENPGDTIAIVEPPIFVLSRLVLTCLDVLSIRTSRFRNGFTSTTKLKIATSSSKQCWILTSATGFTQSNRTSRFFSYFNIDSSFWERREEISVVSTKMTTQLQALALLPRPDAYPLFLDAP